MKKMLSLVLSILMIVTAVPVSVFAEAIENTELFQESDESYDYAELTDEEFMDETSMVPFNYGLEVSIGDDLYYIENGKLKLSNGVSRTQTIATDVTWVIENDGQVYYSVIDGFNTYIYMVGEDSEIAKLFCPTECFDVEDCFVYYSYEGVVYKYNLETQNEEVLQSHKKTNIFYVENDSIFEYRKNDGVDFETAILMGERLDYSTYRSEVEKINASNPPVQPQIRGVNPNNHTGLCNVSTVTILLNRKAKHLGLNDVTFDIFDVFKGCGATNVQYHSTNDNNYKQYTYNGNTGGWNQNKKYVDKNGALSCKMISLQDLPTTEEKLVSLLNSYPEGVAIRVTYEYYRNKANKLCSKGHCIVITDYEYNEDNTVQFYAVDPVNVASGKGRIKLEETWLYRVAKANGINVISNELHICGVLTESKYDPPCSNCKNAGKNSSYKFKTDSKNLGACTSCGTVYNFKATKTSDSTVVGTYNRSSSKYSKLYLRSAPYDYSNTLLESKAYKTLEVTGAIKGWDGGEWYEVEVDGKCGYIVAYKIKADYTRQSSYGTSDITINATEYPQGTIQPKSFGLRGSIDSKYKLNKVQSEVVDASTGKTVLGPVVDVISDAKSVNIQYSKINQNLRFSSLKEGTYYLKYTAWDITDNDSANGNPKVWTSPNFSVKKAVPNVVNCTPPTIQVSNIEYGQKVTVSCGKSDELIHVTTPAGEKTGYNSVSFDVTTPGTYSVRAWTTAGGKVDSLAVTTSYTVSKVSAPIISDVTYTSNGAFVTISGSGDIYYTLDGSTPTKWSKLYDSTIYLWNSTEVKAISTLYGYASSNVVSSYIDVSAPDAPSGFKLTSDKKVAQGGIASVSWNPVERANYYEAYLYLDGELVDKVHTTSTSASFALDVMNDEANLTYNIEVVAGNHVAGTGDASNSVTVTAMHPVTVTVKEAIVRENGVDDELVSEIQNNIDAYFGENAERVEGKIVSIQKIPYGTKPSKPLTPSKKGFTFAGYSAELYYPATQDVTVNALYEINTYSATFYDYSTSEDKRELVPLSSEKYYYSQSAIEPENYSVPEGYIFSGWNIDSSESSGTDYKFMFGDMVIDAVYRWANEDLPVHIRIDNVERDDFSYNVTVSIKNAPSTGTDGVQGRIIAALYTAEGKNVYTTIHDLDSQFLKNIHNYDHTEHITLNYTDNVTSVSVYVVGVVNGKTGGTLSEKAYSDHISYTGENYWSEWSDWVYLDAPVSASDTLQVESKVQYSYSDKQTTTTNNTKYLDGWTYVSTTPHYYGWVNSGTAMYNAENSDYRIREVAADYYVAAVTKEQTRYGKWTNGNYGHFCPVVGRNNYGGTFYVTYTPWYDSEVHSFKWNNSKNRPSIGYCSHNNMTSHGHINSWYDSSDHSDNWYYYIINGYSGYWYWMEKQTVTVTPGYQTYKYKDTYFTHYFERWTDWSGWSFDHPGHVSNRQIDERTVYRFKYVTDELSTVEEPTVFEHSNTITLGGISEDLNGKIGTLMVYKKTNSDPTEDQIEYIEQVVIGEGNTFEYNMNTREKPHYSGTGDYVVALALPESKKLINVDYIKTELPTYTVTFMDDLGNVYAEKEVQLGDSVDVNEVGIPTVSAGMRFVKWNKSVVNISNDIRVTAVTEPELCSIVFVDHENETVEITEYKYGDTISIPESPVKTGYTFVGWSGLESESENVAAGSCVITAEWQPLVFTVKFCDFDGNVVDEQDVEYGCSAQLPELVEDNDGIVYSWDISNNEWWNVTHDMTVYPYVPSYSNVSAPIIDTSTEQVSGSFYANLTTAEETGKIFYSFYTEITEIEAQSFSELFVLGDKSEKDETEIVLAGDVTYAIALNETENDSLIDEDLSMDETYESITDYIMEYSEPIEINEGTVIYSFAVNDQGKVSPVSVFEFGYNDNTYDGETDNLYVIDEECPVIVIPEMSVAPGESVKIPVTMANNPGISELTLVLGYDNNNLQLMEVVNGDVFGDNDFDTDLRDNGSCKMTWYSDDATDKNGTLAILTFVANNEEAVYDLSLSAIVSEDEDADINPFATADGVLSIANTVNNIGDVNNDGETDFSDGILILKHDVGLITLSDKQLEVGDVNGDGEVDFSDAILVLKFDVGLITSFK